MKNQPRIRAVVVDLDRTLLHTDKSLSLYTETVLKKCREQGMRIMVATARPLRTIGQYCARIDFDALVVSNGARVICADRRAEYGICPESAERLLRVLSCRPELRVTLETGERAYSNLPISDYETILSDDLIGIAGAEGVLKILVHMDGAGTLEFVEKELTEDLYAMVANGYLIQIMSKSATKWNGVKAMLEIVGCSPEETAYFGDDYDDLEPIQRCGIGVAVANAIDEVRAVADDIAQSNDADGVARFIAQRFLR